MVELDLLRNVEYGGRHGVQNVGGLGKNTAGSGREVEGKCWGVSLLSSVGLYALRRGGRQSRFTQFFGAHTAWDEHVSVISQGVPQRTEKGPSMSRTRP